MKMGMSRNALVGTGMQDTNAGRALHKKAQDILTNEQQKGLFKNKFLQCIE